MSVIPIIDKTLGIIEKGIEYLTLLAKTADIRRAKSAIEAAEKYIQVNRKVGGFKDITTTRQQQLLKHYSRWFFYYN